MAQSNQYEDVEIFIRRPNTDGDDEEYVWTASYRDMAHLSNHTVIESISGTELETGGWVVGIRESGDEQYTHSFEITPLMADAPDYNVQNHVAAVLNHWRQ